MGEDDAWKLSISTTLPSGFTARPKQAGYGAARAGCNTAHHTVGDYHWTGSFETHPLTVDDQAEILSPVCSVHESRDVLVSSYQREKQ